ncbi:L,D-transpeptidase family protein [Luteimicrobium sp. DT211]|uniref:L,D-transpeptidase family protein n=1 Tax=Luteimicrobium sp. DT211 TaxID=3393412 RepID=UPI003CF17782
MVPVTSHTRSGRASGRSSRRTRLLALGAAGLAVALTATACGTGSPTPQAPVVVSAAPTTSDPDGTTTGSPTGTPTSSPTSSGTATPDASATTGSTPSPTHAAASPTPTPSGTPTSKAADDAKDGTTGNATDSGDDKPKNDKPKSTEHTELRSGDHGARVKELQQRLVSLGYWLPSVDGAFGPSTLQAVWAVQKAAGLQRDGLVGKNTQKAIDRGVRPTARSHHGHVIEVDLGKQLVLIVDDGHVSTILNASSGSGKPFTSKNGHQYIAHTPTGTYRMGRQYDGMYTSNLGLGTMWRPKFFNGGIALHGLGFDVPPYPASHGCVRISNPAMDWVWSTGKAPQGTTVTVYA